MVKRKKIMFEEDFVIVKLAFFAVIASTGGWFVFKALTHPTLLPIDNLSPFWLLAIGLGISWAVFKLGLKKRK